jgi:hypothetical protein
MSALDALINNFKANQGTMPQVNPPAAVKVLETQTKPETEGKPEPAISASAAAPAASATATVTPANTAASSASAEPEAKTRRTAAVVQAELDQVAAELAQTKAQLAAEMAAHCGTTGALKELRASFDQGKQEFDALKAELAKAVEFAKSVVADNAKLAEQPAADGAALTLAGCAEYLKKQGFGIFTLGGE